MSRLDSPTALLFLCHSFSLCEYFVSAEARRVLDGLHWLKHAYILQVNTTQMQYCITHNEC